MPHLSPLTPHPSPFLQAINGEDITVYGEGAQTRSFCFVDDLVDGLIRLMNQEETVGPVNIGNPGEFTIKQLAELAIKTTGSKSKIIHLPLPGDDPKQRKPDITKARKYLGWEPKVPLEEGIVTVQPAARPTARPTAHLAVPGSHGPHASPFAPSAFAPCSVGRGVFPLARFAPLQEADQAHGAHEHRGLAEVQEAEDALSLDAGKGCQALGSRAAVAAEGRQLPAAAAGKSSEVC